MRADCNDPMYSPEMPPTEGGAHLVAYLFEVGPTMASGMGTGPLTHQELQAWQQGIGLVLQPWEFRFLRRLSAEYATESHRAQKADAPAPWVDPASEEYRLEVLPDRIRSMFRE